MLLSRRLGQRLRPCLRQIFFSTVVHISEGAVGGSSVRVRTAPSRSFLRGRLRPDFRSASLLACGRTKLLGRLVDGQVEVERDAAEVCVAFLTADGHCRARCVCCATATADDSAKAGRHAGRWSQCKNIDGRKRTRPLRRARRDAPAVAGWSTRPRDAVPASRLLQSAAATLRGRAQGPDVAGRAGSRRRLVSSRFIGELYWGSDNMYSFFGVSMVGREQNAQRDLHL